MLDLSIQHKSWSERQYYTLILKVTPEYVKRFPNTTFKVGEPIFHIDITVDPNFHERDKKITKKIDR